MLEKPNTQSSCDERKRLNQELSMLLDSKAAIREQIASGMIANPAERRASLVRTNEMIDDVIALMSEHYQHCSCEALCVQAPPATGTEGRRQKPRQSRLAAFSNMVRG